MTTVTIGVDPGLRGALACLANGDLFDVEDMPTRVVGKRANGKDKHQVDIVAVAATFLRWGLSCDRGATPTVVIEKVQASPGAGATSMFTFGEGFGQLVGLCAGLGWVWTLAPPHVWKGALGLSSDKDRSRLLATDRFPDWAGEFVRKRDDGRAEAALIADWWEATSTPRRGRPIPKGATNEGQRT